MEILNSTWIPDLEFLCGTFWSHHGLIRTPSGGLNKRSQGFDLKGEVLSQLWHFPQVQTGNTISGPGIPKARPDLSAPEGTCPSPGAGTQIFLGIIPHVAIPDLHPGLPIHCEWTSVVTCQEQATSSFTYNLLSTIYVVAWMHSHQLDSSSVRLLDHDPDPSFCSNVL